MEKIIVEVSKCTKCGKCVKICPNNALDLVEEYPRLVRPDMCTECGICEDQCSASAIRMTNVAYTGGNGGTTKGDPGLVEASAKLVNLLGLTNDPVGVTLLKPGQTPPGHFSLFGSPTRHCVSIHMASLGASIHVPAKQHACAAAKAALGISALPEKVASGQIPHMHGLAASEAAAARVMAEVPRLPVGSAIGTLVGPLWSFVQDPDVVILVVKPKQAMWVANSLLFETGSPRITANFAGMQASCADVTTVPIKTGEVNFTMGCYGCRSAGKLDDEELYVGIPVKKLEEVLRGLKGLKRAMGKLDEAEHKEAEAKKGCGN